MLSGRRRFGHVRDIAGNIIRVATQEEEEARPGGGGLTFDNQSDPPAEVTTIVAPGAVLTEGEAHLSATSILLGASSPVQIEAVTGHTILFDTLYDNVSGFNEITGGLLQDLFPAGLGLDFGILSGTFTTQEAGIWAYEFALSSVPVDADIRFTLRVSPMAHSPTFGPIIVGSNAPGVTGVIALPAGVDFYAQVATLAAPAAPGDYDVLPYLVLTRLGAARFAEST